MWRYLIKRPNLLTVLEIKVHPINSLLPSDDVRHFIQKAKKMMMEEDIYTLFRVRPWRQFNLNYLTNPWPFSLGRRQLEGPTLGRNSQFIL